MALMAKKKPTSAHKHKPFQLRMPEVLKQELEELAEEKFTTVTAEIIQAIVTYLRNNGRQVGKSASED